MLGASDLVIDQGPRQRPVPMGVDPGPIAQLDAHLPAQPQLSIATTDHILFVGTWGSGVYRAPLDEPEFRLLAPGTDGGGLRDKNITAVLGRVSAGQPWVGSFGGGPQLVDVVAGSVAPTGGPTTEPCGVCKPCIGISEGRFFDVLEIDAASSTGVDNIRELNAMANTRRVRPSRKWCWRT